MSATLTVLEPATEAVLAELPRAGAAEADPASPLIAALVDEARTYREERTGQAAL